MIFVTVGSMFPFDRLIKTVDVWIETSGYREVLFQIGNGAYRPAHARWVRSLTPVEFTQSIRNCDVLVAHLGMGSIISAMQARKPVILLPRRVALGEVTSDHQVHGTAWLRGRQGIWIADDETTLARLLDEFVQGAILAPTESASQYASPELIEKVRAFISQAAA